MRTKPFFLWTLVILGYSGSLSAQNILDNFQLHPIKDDAVVRMKTLHVKMKRTLEVKDSAKWKPTVCDYWDSTYFTYSKNTIQSLFIGYNPMEISDKYQVHSCTDEAGPKMGYPAEYKMTHQDSVRMQEQINKPVVMWPAPSDSIISTYNNEGYLLSKINKIHSGKIMPLSEYYYFDAVRLVGNSSYDFFGLKDSTHCLFDAEGKVLQWIKVSQHALLNGGVVRNNLHFAWDTMRVMFEYDAKGNCIDIYQKYQSIQSKDSAGHSVLFEAKNTIRTSQVFDSLGRITAVITYYNKGILDTIQRWAYAALGDIQTRFDTTAGKKQPMVYTDSNIFDDSHTMIGKVHTSFTYGHITREKIIHGRVVSRELSSSEGGKVQTQYTLETDAMGNMLKETTIYNNATYSPASEILEYKYDKNGLLSDAFYVYTDSKKPSEPMKRHLQYLYQFSKK